MMKLILVENKKQATLFLEMPLAIYKNDANYIRPLDKDVEEVFDVKKNKFFKHGECQRWLLANDKGEFIGRIAAFTNKKYKQNQPTGGIGFFECIDNQEAANFMFDHCQQWLVERGMEAMDGPINFGERDKFWGLLVEGFDEPLYGLNYNPPYYKTLIENYGFQVYFHQLCYGINKKLTDQFDPKYHRIHDIYNAKPDFKFDHIRKNNLNKYAEDFCTIYNAAFAKHGEGKSMDLRQAKAIFASMKDVLDEKLGCFVYYKDQPICMWVSLPDLNQYFKYFNGKLGIIEKLRFLWMQKFKPTNRFIGIAYGVVPEWQGKGTDAYMIVKAAALIKDTNYQKFEMQWIGDFNPKMVNLAAGLGSAEIRRLSTYRFLFDRQKEFKRHPILN